MYDEAHGVDNNLYGCGDDGVHPERVPKTLPMSEHLQELQLRRGSGAERGVSFRVQMQGLQSTTGQVHHLTVVLILHDHQTHLEPTL